MTAIEGSRVLMSHSPAARPTLAVSYGSHNERGARRYSRVFASSASRSWKPRERCNEAVVRWRSDDPSLPRSWCWQARSIAADLAWLDDPAARQTVR